MIMKQIITSTLLLSVAMPVFALTPNDTLYSQQWYLQAISAPQAWDVTTGSSKIVVAVLDTGFDMDHPDLVGNVWTNLGEIPEDGLDNDQNGFVDDVHGYDFVDHDAQPWPDVSEPIDEGALAHGTMIAGIIGATASNNMGIAGINWQTRLMNLRILDKEGTGDSLSAADAIAYAVDNGADVINLSFTGTQTDSVLKNALKRAFDAGVVIVAAVGNTKDGGTNVDISPIYPACHGENEDEDWVIGVAASDQNDQKSTFSNYGALCTDLSAPGEEILSTTYQDDSIRRFASSYYEDGWAGTSLAAPMVSGAAALLKSKYPTIKPKDVETVLRLSADPILTSGDAIGKSGAGRLNIAKALELAPAFMGIVPLTVSGIPDAQPNSLVKSVCVGETAIDDPCRTVYFYATDGKRHTFANEKVFFSWFKNFDSVQTISKSSLSSLPLGKNVTYHPGSTLVKFQSVPTVYAVSKGGVLKAVESETIASELYGSTWNKKVDDISDAFYSHYKIGKKITSVFDFDVSAEFLSVTSLNDNF